MSQVVYALSSRGITQLSYESVIDHLTRKYRFRNKDNAKRLMDVFSSIHIGEAEITFIKDQFIGVGHGTLIKMTSDFISEKEKYEIIVPYFFNEVRRDFLNTL